MNSRLFNANDIYAITLDSETASFFVGNEFSNDTSIFNYFFFLVIDTK